MPDVGSGGPLGYYITAFISGTITPAVVLSSSPSLLAPTLSSLLSSTACGLTIKYLPFLLQDRYGVTGVTVTSTDGLKSFSG